MGIAGRRLVLATGNQGKVREFEQILDGCCCAMVSLRDYPGLVMPPENGDSFLENARIKARAVGEQLGEWVLSDDSGLEVEALHGGPGIHSARYAGPDAGDQANNRKLLESLEGVPPGRRGAAFVCVLLLRSPAGEEWSFAGRCPGRIATTLSGRGGFGYDPLFLVPPDYRRTMAELAPDEKNRISHRGAALRCLRHWLESAGGLSDSLKKG